ncbi:MAG: hypothetical protein WA807_01715 [Steroidobacteraceae bacterium]
MNLENLQKIDDFAAKHKWVSTMPALAYAMVVVPFIYRNTLGEIDLSQMAFAIIHGQATGLGEAAGYHYGYPISFGYYYFIYNVAPNTVLLSSTQLIAFMNVLGCCSAIVAVALLGLYLCRLYDARVALVTTLLFAFSPMYLELGTYGHPELPAFCLLLLGAYLLTFATGNKTSTAHRAVAAASAMAAILAALCVRSDVLLALPFLAIARRGKSDTIRAYVQDMLPRVVPIIAAALGFFVLQRIILTSFGTSGHTELMQYLASADDLGATKKALVIIVFGTGIASVILCAFVIVMRRLRPLGIVDALAIGSMVLLSVVLWLPNPAPARHFLFVSLAVALVIGLGFAQRASLSLLLAVGILTPAANQALAELFYPAVIAKYDWAYYRPPTERRATRAVPMGFFVRDHRANQMNFTRLRNEGIALAQACDSQRRALVFADEPYYYLMALAERDSTLQLNTVEPELGARVVHAKGKLCETAVVSKYMAWPQDVVPRFLADSKYEGWHAYFQESTRGLSDRTQIPTDRLIRLSNPSTTN